MCADGERLPLFDGMEKYVVAQDMSLNGLKERLPAAFQPLKQVGAAESHQSLACAGEIVENVLFFNCCVAQDNILRRHVVTQTIAGQVEPVDGVNYIRRIETRILVSVIFLINLELDCSWETRWEIGASAVFKSQKLATSRRVGFGVVLLNETAGTAHEIQAHQFTPVIGVFTFFERCQ